MRGGRRGGNQKNGKHGAIGFDDKAGRKERRAVIQVTRGREDEVEGDVGPITRNQM